MRVGVYLRVSSFKPKKDKTGKLLESRDKGQDTEMQLREIQAYLKAHNLTDYEVFEDKGVSGTKDSRPGLNRLMGEVKQRKIQMVICWKLDRLFRSLRHILNTLEDFEKHGVTFVALRDNIDLNTVSGRFMMQILAAVGEFEAAIGRERTIAGLNNARENGVKLGRRYNTVSWAAVNALRTLRPTATLADLGRELGISRATVYRILKAPPQ